MGALIAERLTRDGHVVALIDRRPPAHGSTAASTALVMWAADVPLTRLADRCGEKDAGSAWRCVHQAVQALSETIGDDTEAVRWRGQPELYLSGRILDAQGLQAEARLRRSAGLPSEFLDPAEVRQRFDLPDRAALLSSDCFVVDPILLTVTMLRRAQARGATISFPADVVAIEHEQAGVALTLGDGRTLHARQAIIASGYEIARWYLPPSFTLGSSYAIATAPGVIPEWGKEVLIWEASSPYLYARATDDGRIVIGGEDEDLVDAPARDRLLQEKRGLLEARGAALLGVDGISADCAWAATFGTSPDGLPAIGRARNGSNIWIAAGFGGNGISFAALAASLIGDDICGKPQRTADLFNPYRFD